jgi:hypothetical protein
MLVLMPIMKQRTIPLFKKQGAQSTARRSLARWGPHAAIGCSARWVRCEACRVSSRGRPPC